MNRSRAQSAPIAILLALALLCAQWVGLAHRIHHAQMQAHAYSPAISQTDDGSDRGTRHSCAAFDAAAVGDLVHIAPFVAPLLASAQVLALWAAFISWDAVLVPCYSSRAPPLS